jgi:hypothetical protein
MAKELLEEFGITTGLKKRFPKQPEQAEELIAEYGKYYWQLRDILRKPLVEKRGGFKVFTRKKEED